MIISAYKGLSVWQLRILFIVSGGFLPLALAPYYILIFLPFTIGLVFIFLLFPSSKLSHFSCGWWFGIGFNGVGFYWLINAFLVEADKFAWLFAPCFIVFISVLSVFTAFSVFLSGLCFRHVDNIFMRAIVFSCCWSLLEYIRALLPFGFEFPWNLLGISLNFSAVLIQPASLGGVWLLSFIVVLLTCLIVIFLIDKDNAVRSIISFLLIVLFLSSFGLMRINYFDDMAAPKDTVHLVLVQPNISQSRKWKKRYIGENVRRHVELSQEVLDYRQEDKIVLIWPEIAVPFFLDKQKVAREYLSSILPSRGILVLGALASAPSGLSYNSIYVIDSKADILARYDKHLLVPFGEYIPFYDVFKDIISSLTNLSGSFARGEGAQTLYIDNLAPFSPLICYEAIFPGRVTDNTGRAKWLLNVSNDAWFGLGIGPHQHFALSRLRSVEEGVPLVRVANTGITAIIDSFGRIVERLDLGKMGVIEGKLPVSMTSTVYSVYGDWFIILVFLTIFSVFISAIKFRLKNNSDK